MIRYSNGKIYNQKKIIQKHNHKTKQEISLSSRNRGMSFENDINLSNEYYKNNNVCLIYKRPTPINVVKVDYSKGALITQAYFEAQSTTDYNGVYKGKYIDFEAKSTLNRTSFPISNITIHQINHLKNVIKNGGIAFFLIEFKSLNKIYLLDAKNVIDFYEFEDRKSIPINYFLDNGIEIKTGFNPRIDYIPAVDKKYF